MHPQLEQPLGTNRGIQIGRSNSKSKLAGSKPPVSVRRFIAALERGALDKAVAAANEIADGDIRAAAQHAVVQKSMNEDQYGLALIVARRIQLPAARDHSLNMIGQDLASLERWKACAQIAAEISDPDVGRDLRLEIATLMASARHVKQAIELIRRSITDPEERDESLAMMCYEFGLIHEDALGALEMAHCIQSRNARDAALTYVVSGLANNGDFEQAKSILRQVENNDNRARALRDLATALSAHGRAKEAFSLALTIPDEEVKHKTLYDIARHLGREADNGRLAEIGRILNEDVHQLIECQAKIEQLLARGNYTQALALASTSKYLSVPRSQLEGIFIKLVQTHKWNEALDILEAGSLMLLSFPPDSRARLHEHIVSGEQSLRNPGILQTFIKRATEIEESFVRNHLLDNVVAAFSGVGLWDQAAVVIDYIDDPQGKLWAVSRIAEDKALAGEWNGALELARSQLEPGDKVKAIYSALNGYLKSNIMET